MNNHIEIELRYEVLDMAQILSFLASAKKLHTKHDIDVYFDTPARILWKRGIFIRIRNDKKLDIKFNRACLHDSSIERLDYCEEYSFSLPLQQEALPKINDVFKNLDLNLITEAHLDSFKSSNDFEEHYVVDKVRTSYEYNSFTIAIDDVAGLGTFLEIEQMAHNADDLENVKNDMRTTLAGLPLRPVRLGYCSQVLKKTQFECYLQGRYILKEDLVSSVK